MLTPERKGRMAMEAKRRAKLGGRVVFLVSTVVVALIASAGKAQTNGEGMGENTAPIACIAEGGRTIEAGWEWEAKVALDGSCSSDADSAEGTNDDINDFAWYEVVDICDPNRDIFLGSGEIIECNLPLGAHVIVLKVIDNRGASDSNEAVITVEDILMSKTGPNEPNAAVIAYSGDSSNMEKSAVDLAGIGQGSPANSGKVIGWGGQVVGVDLSSGFASVAGGWYHSLGLKTDGSIVAWGFNMSGQCNVPLPNTGFIAAVGGHSHSLSLKADGSIVAWGWNGYGQCNVPSPNNGFVAVAAGFGHSLGLKGDGSIVAWGLNNFGQCSIPAPNTGFVAVAAGAYHSLGLKADGSIVAWGRNSYGQCNVPSPNTGFVEVAAGWGYSLGLKTDGSIVAWGRNSYGQCNVPSPNTGFVMVETSYGHNLGLKEDGSIVAWGRNYEGQCNIPSPNSGFVAVAAGTMRSLGLKADGSIVTWGSGYFVPSPNRGFAAVAAGYYHSLGLKTDSSIVAWGSQPWYHTPTPNGDFIAIAAGGGHSLLLKADGTIVVVGNVSGDDYGQCNVPAPNSNFVAVAGSRWHSLGVKQDGSIRAWGRNDDGQCDMPSPNTGFVAVAAGWHHSLGLKQDGSIVAWGLNNFGQCDLPSLNSDFVAVAAGAYHSLGLKQDGTIVAWGSSGLCNIPLPNSDYVAIAAGYFHSLGLKADGSVVGWGRNDEGQCNVPAPNNSGFVAVAGGGYHSLAVLAVEVPVACIEGGDRIIAEEGSCEARVVLDGSCSSDADNTEGTDDDINDFDWYEVINGCEPNSDIYLGSGEVIECNLGLGEHLIMLEVTDKAGAFDNDEVVVTVVDRAAPVITLNGAETVILECRMDSYVEESATAIDNCDDFVPVLIGGDTVDTSTCGTYVVTYDATDDSGNAALQVTRTVVVRDTLPPEIECPADIALEAMGPSGAVATFTATSSDLCDPEPEVTFSIPSGSIFAIGVTGVVCTSTDSSGNSSMCNFTVTVQDTTPPAISCTADIILEATGPSGAVATYTVTATDLVDPSPQINLSHPSGSMFGLGTTGVVCTATDASGNSSVCSFTVMVQDTTPPVIMLNGSATVVLECGVDDYSEEGAVATDLCDGNVSVVIGGDTVDTLACGSYVVTYDAIDSRSNLAEQVVRTIIVQDTTAPEITCPSDIMVAARWPWGVVVTFEPIATDLCDSQVEVLCEPPSGSVFAAGTTAVVCTATDASGNSSSCSFDVTVVPPMEMAMHFTPEVLNPGSEGNLMKAHFVLPEGYEIGDVDVNTPAVLQPLGIESEYINVFIDEGRGRPVGVEVGFERRSFCEAAGDFGPAEVTVSVRLTSGEYFYGTDTIRIIANNLKYLGVFASYWLAADCGAPDWCVGSDFDKNTVVDFADFALFDGCCVEVITE